MNLEISKLRGKLRALLFYFSIIRWPRGYWDDWVRLPAQRQGRTCIYPEYPRTYTFGLFDGTSNGQFANEYLKNIKLNEENIDWTQIDVSYLLKNNYEALLTQWIKSTITVSPTETDNYIDEYLLVEYDPKEYEDIFDSFMLMSDEKSGILRTSYEGVVIFRRHSNRVFLAPVGLKDSL